MDIQQFHEIIDFAVKKEVEAVEFYNQLKSNAKFSAYKEMLQEFENMEKAHIVKLEQIRKNYPKISGNLRTKKKITVDLKISDNIEEVENPASYSDYILVAMKREEKALQLYSKLAEYYSDDSSELSEIFTVLANEEGQHKLKFEKIYDDTVLKEN